VPLTAKEPTNMAFGGADGRTLFVTQRKGGFIESFRVARPGREFCLQASCPK
jgi:signal peptidase